MVRYPISRLTVYTESTNSNLNTSSGVNHERRVDIQVHTNGTRLVDIGTTAT